MLTHCWCSNSPLEGKVCPLECNTKCSTQLGHTYFSPSDGTPQTRDVGMVTEISEQDPLFNYNEGITLSEIWSGE